ncbi:unnamed protein product [Allacma fusca]|uniref:Uncharacterized protein n=1 Tax=Allacma fusca TaxID=39272 RepID=A0A8J2KEC5_9HEXA|nr:unnamed protein product [Allacma fusca]
MDKKETSEENEAKKQKIIKVEGANVRGKTADPINIPVIPKKTNYVYIFLPSVVIRVLDNGDHCTSPVGTHLCHACGQGQYQSSKLRVLLQNEPLSSNIENFQVYWTWSVF